MRCINHQSSIGIWCNFISIISASPASARKFQRTLTCPTHPALLHQHEHRGKFIRVVASILFPRSKGLEAQAQKTHVKRDVTCSPTSPALPLFDMDCPRLISMAMCNCSSRYCKYELQRQWISCWKTGKLYISRLTFRTLSNSFDVHLACLLLWDATGVITCEYDK